MLWYLVEQTRKVVGANGLFSLTTDRERSAAEGFFLKRMGNGFFPNLNHNGGSRPA